MKKRLWFLLPLVCVLFLASCGDDDTSSGDTGTRTTDDNALKANCGIVENGKRLVSHALGKTSVSAHPTQVVVLDTAELDAVTALGVQPVGVTEVGEGVNIPGYLREAAEKAERVGTIQQPNLESIAFLQPDLILTSAVRHEPIHEQLSRIAPTVMAKTVGASWKENFLLFSETLGQCEEGNRLVQEYETRAATLGQDLGEKRTTTEVSVIRALGGTVRMYMNDSFIGSVLQDVGLPRPKSQDKNIFMEEAGIERIPDMDGTVIFLTKWGDRQPRLEQLQASPLWDNLEAVQTGQVYEVSDQIWMLGMGVLGANRVLDDLRSALVETS